MKITEWSSSDDIRHTSSSENFENEAQKGSNGVEPDGNEGVYDNDRKPAKLEGLKGRRRCRRSGRRSGRSSGTLLSLIFPICRVSCDLIRVHWDAQVTWQRTRWSRACKNYGVKNMKSERKVPGPLLIHSLIWLHRSLCTISSNGQLLSFSFWLARLIPCLWERRLHVQIDSSISNSR